MIKKWYVQIPELSGDEKRRVYLYLPASYRRHPEQRYPVMYMFDGHNVFFDGDAAFGRSWRMGEYMQRSKKQLIIVAVECNHQGNRRLMEYTPVTYRNKDHGLVQAKAPVYMKWLVNRLKPYVDNTLRTIPDRDHTTLAGSSMGGLIALYGVTAYNHIFRQAACLSPSLWVAPVKILAILAHAGYTQDTAIYLSYGQNEMGNHKANRRVIGLAAKKLYAKGVNLTLRIARDAYHCEADWEKEVPIFMECLGL